MGLSGTFCYYLLFNASSNEEIKQMGGEQETSKLKKEGGKSKSDLYRDKDGHIWNRLKEKGKGEWEYVGEAEWWGLE